MDQPGEYDRPVERRALTWRAKIAILVATIVLPVTALFAFGWWLGGVLGWFAPLITFPVGYLCGCLACSAAMNWLDTYPTRV